MSPLFLVPTSPLPPLAPADSAKVLGGSPIQGLSPSGPSQPHVSPRPQTRRMGQGEERARMAAG